MARDPNLLAHQQWLGYLQPVGLVVASAALVQAQAFVGDVGAGEHRRFLEYLTDGGDPAGERLAIRDLPRLLIDVLGWQSDDLLPADDPRAAGLEVVLPSYHETLRPTWAVPAPPPADASPWLLLIQELPAGTPLDRLAAGDERHCQATPQERFQRLLRETRVPIGLLSNATHLRLVYAPPGESVGHLTFPVAATAKVARRDDQGEGALPPHLPPCATGAERPPAPRPADVSRSIAMLTDQAVRRTEAWLRITLGFAARRLSHGRPRWTSSRRCRLTSPATLCRRGNRERGAGSPAYSLFAGTRTRRKPTSELRLAASHQALLPARQNLLLDRKPPPRTHRYVEFVLAESSVRLSLHHSATFPCISYKPNLLAS